MQHVCGRCGHPAKGRFQAKRVGAKGALVRNRGVSGYGLRDLNHRRTIYTCMPCYPRSRTHMEGLNFVIKGLEQL